ncbi:MAG: 4Fe-4S binding protein [Candidatus Parcubacteria bacterium]|nr:4Fe-4S binding protein [Candidatus Parcubacteria bacterium]
MGHLTSKNYLSLQQRLERSTQGAPASEALFKILEILFSEQEAALASVLPLNVFSLNKAAKIWGLPLDKSKKILDELSEKGLLLDIAKGDEQYYVLAPTMAGFFEFSLMRTDGKFDRQILSELYYQYINLEENFKTSIFKLEPTIDRVFIQENSIEPQDQPEVLDYEKATKVIESASCITVGTCYCRHKMEHLGKACNQPQDVCLTFNTSAKSLSKHGIARKISKTEALELLNQCIKNGLVQIGDNIQDNVNWICNCCSCCCEALLAYKKLGYRNIKSNFYAKANESCTGCGICLKKCPVDAIGIKNKKALVNKDLCIGCGVCANFCPKQALSMHRYKSVKFTPKDSFERFVINAIDENKLQNFIFDNYHLWSYEIFRKLLRTILTLKTVKQNLAKQQLRSKFLNILTQSDTYSHPELKQD